LEDDALSFLANHQFTEQYEHNPSPGSRFVSVQVGKEGEIIEREVSPIVEPGLQERAEAALEANKRRAPPERKNARRYLLSGLVRCGICGFACSGHTTPGEGKNYSYYGCMSNRGECGTKSVT
jgi:hypothetical protein